MTDEELVSGLFRREEAALNQVQETYRSYARSLAVRILGSLESAEEVCADVWLRVWQSIPPNKPENLKMYIARLTRNRALQVLDSEQAQKRSAIRVQFEELAECLPDSAAAIDPERIALREALGNFVTRLPREKRIIFLRRYFYGDTVPEIAQRFGCKPGRVTGILYRIRQELKTHLEQEGFDL